MNMDNYKRDFRFRSGEGENGGFKWLIILCALVVIGLAFFLK